MTSIENAEMFRKNKFHIRPNNTDGKKVEGPDRMDRAAWETVIVTKAAGRGRKFRATPSGHEARRTVTFSSSREACSEAALPSSADTQPLRS